MLLFLPKLCLDVRGDYRRFDSGPGGPGGDRWTQNGPPPPGSGPSGGGPPPRTGGPYDQRMEMERRRYILFGLLNINGVSTTLRHTTAIKNSLNSQTLKIGSIVRKFDHKCQIVRKS